MSLNVAAWEGYTRFRAAETRTGVAVTRHNLGIVVPTRDVEKIGMICDILSHHPEALRLMLYTPHEHGSHLRPSPDAQG